MVIQIFFITYKSRRFINPAVKKVRRERALQRSLFVLLCILTSSIFCAKPSMAQMTVKFKASKPYKSKDIMLRAKIFKPEGLGQFPAVILMHGCGGWQPAVKYALQAHAQYLVKHGFAVLSLDSFGPRQNSGGKVCESFKYLRQARTYRSYDAFDALRYLQAQDFINPDNIFLMGQSNGGSVAIKVAKANAPRNYGGARSGFRGVVAYYPWCGAFGGSKVSLGSPLLVFGGGQDDWVPPTACKRVRSKGAKLNVKIYPAAAHSFDLNIIKQRYNGKLVGYDKRATQDSRSKMMAFFKENLTLDLRTTQLSMLEQP